MKKIWLILALIVTTVPVQASYRILADIAVDSAHTDSVVRVTHHRIVQLIGPYELDSLDIYIVASQKRFDSLSGNAVPDWGAAVAIPLRRRVVIKSPRILAGEKSLGELVAHEYAHIALARAVLYQPVPRWLNEGMSMYVSAEWGWADNLSISWAVVLGSVVPLSEIEYLNRFQGDRVAVAYSESYLAFKYLIDTYGSSGLQIILSTIRAGGTFDEAFIAATGVEQDSFEREFLTFLNGRYNLLTVLFNSNIIWILLALLIIVGFILNRIRRRKKMNEFDEYEKYHSTDFDYGEVEKPDDDEPWR